VAGTRISPLLSELPNTMVPSSPHAAPRPAPRIAQMVCGAPPDSGTRINSAPLKKPIHCSSGATKGR
jgi:hypothetical protein